MTTSIQRSSTVSRRNFLLGLLMTGCLFALLALRGPDPSSIEREAELELRLSLADVVPHPPRVLLQASQLANTEATGEDLPPSETNSALVASTPAVVSPVDQHVGNEPESEDGLEGGEKSEILAKLTRRGWQGPLEVKRALEILRRTDKMFSEAGRDYFLSDGSLLGYCRHEGSFTPWDDDMDMATAKENVEWLLSPEGRRLVEQYGMKLKMLGSGYMKLWLDGEDIPSAGDCSWGYPFLDVFPYAINASTGLLDIVGSDESYSPNLYLPPRRVSFHPSLSHGLLVPSQSGQVLDLQFSDWRTECKVQGWNHRLETGDDSLSGDCAEFAHLLGEKLAPSDRCPSPSMNKL